MVGVLIQASHADIPIRQFADRLVEVFAREVFETRRKDVIRLVLTEGARFPKLAEFYYREVISRVLAAIRALLQRAIERGELRHDALREVSAIASGACARRHHVERPVRPVRAARCSRADARPFRYSVR